MVRGQYTCQYSRSSRSWRCSCMPGLWSGTRFNTLVLAACLQKGVEPPAPPASCLPGHCRSPAWMRLSWIWTCEPAQLNAILVRAAMVVVSVHSIRPRLRQPCDSQLHQQGWPHMCKHSLVYYLGTVARSMRCGTVVSMKNTNKENLAWLLLAWLFFWVCQQGLSTWDFKSLNCWTEGNRFSA